MSDFVELETNRGKVLVNLDDISYLQSSGVGTEAILNLKSGLTFTVLEPYETVSGFIQWISDGRPELEHDENCPDCGNKIEDEKEEVKN